MYTKLQRVFPQKDLRQWTTTVLEGQHAGMLEHPHDCDVAEVSPPPTSLTKGKQKRAHEDTQLFKRATTRSKSVVKHIIAERLMTTSTSAGQVRGHPDNHGAEKS